MHDESLSQPFVITAEYIAFARGVCDAAEGSPEAWEGIRVPIGELRALLDAAEKQLENTDGEV